MRVRLERHIDALPRDEEAAVGYYAVTMRPWLVRCEPTVTRHVGVHRYIFPAEQDAYLLFDAAACITAGGGLPGSHADYPSAWDSGQGSTGGWLQCLTSGS